MSKESEDLDPMDFEDFKKILFANDPETEQYYIEIEAHYNIIPSIIN